MEPGRAQQIGLDALLWLTGRPELFESFVALTGTGFEDLRAAAENPELLAAVLDFLLTSDETVSAFAAEAGVSPHAPMQARSALPGGTHHHWT